MSPDDMVQCHDQQPICRYILSLPHNNVKRRKKSHTAFLNCNIIYWRLDDTGELLSEQQTYASLSRGLRSMNVNFRFSHTCSRHCLSCISEHPRLVSTVHKLLLSDLLLVT